jgi:hypothetical protein
MGNMRNLSQVNPINEGGNQASNMANIANVVGIGGEKGTSLNDVKDQEIKGIGKAPIRRELDQSPMEKAKDEYSPLRINDPLQAIQLDANIVATENNREGLPE